MQFVKPTLFEEAVQKLGSKSVIGSQLNSEQWAGMPAGLRDRALWSAKIEDMRFLQRGKDALGDFLTGARETVVGPDGVERTALRAGSRQDFVRQMSAFAISEGMGPLDPELKGGLQDITSQRRLNLVFDVQTQSMQSYGYWKQGMDKDVLNEFPAQRFIREVDVKVPRPIHQQNEGVVRLKTDVEFWTAMNSPAIGGFGVPWGPWGFGSGMGTEDVDRDETERMGLIRKGEELQPVDKDVNDSLEASTRGLDPEMLDLLKNSFGDQITIEGDRARWNVPAAPIAPVPVPVPEPTPFPKPTPRPQPKPEPTNPKSIDDVVKQLGLENKAKVTAEDMVKLREELKETNPAKASDMLRNISGTPYGALQKEQIEKTVQEFLDFFPENRVSDLPKLEIKTSKMDARGEYLRNGVVKLNKELQFDAATAKRVTFHELMHWVHMEGDSAYKELIRAHFEARTAGEKTISLPGYKRNVKGKLDKWYEVYAGRVYRNEHIPQGLEIPTRYIEWLTFTPEKMAALYNDPNFRETLHIVLRALF